MTKEELYAVRVGDGAYGQVARDQVLLSGLETTFRDCSPAF